MKNKKGIAWIKTILFFALITLFTILVIFIMQYIKKANKDKLKANKNELRMIEPTEYNPINDIYSYYIYSYANSNFAINSNYATNVFNYESNSNVYYWGQYISSDNSQHINAIWNNTTSSYTFPLAQEVNKNDNILYLAKDLYNSHYIARNHISWNSVRSWSIGYNCDINVKDFNFLMHYNYPINDTTKNIYFYIYTDSGSMRVQLTFNTSSTIYNFSYSLIESTLPSASKVLRFGFGFAQSSSTSNAIYYLPQSNGSSGVLNGVNYDSSQVYENYFNTLTLEQKNNICYMEFITSNYPPDYLQGYNNGYNDALINANTTINTLNTNIIELQNQINDLTTTISNQNRIITTLQQQLNEQQSNFKGFFFTMADVPVRTISNVLGFEVFGVNLFQFFIGALTALGCIWLIKKFL